MSSVEKTFLREVQQCAETTDWDRETLHFYWAPAQNISNFSLADSMEAKMTN
jgi:hypothetical protein